MPRDSSTLGKQFQQIDTVHTEIVGEVNKMNTMIKNGLQESQDDLLLAYKLEMQKVERDYQEINKKINDDKASAKLEAKIDNIRQELNWFKAEADRLCKKYDEQKVIITKMKAALDVEEEDRDFYQQQLMKNRKINKNAAIQIKAYRRKYPQLELMNENNQEEDGDYDDQGDHYSLNELLKEQLDDVDDRERRGSEINKEEIKNPEEEFPMPKSEKLIQLQDENEKLKKVESQSIMTMNNLKKQLDQVAKECREFRAHKAADNLKRSEVKEFFLNCIEEIRKEIIHKRTMGNFTKTKRSATEEHKFRNYGSKTRLGTSSGVVNPKIKNEPYQNSEKE